MEKVDVTVGLCVMGNYFKHYFKDDYENYKNFMRERYRIGEIDNDLSFFENLLWWIQPIGQGGCPDYLVDILIKYFNKDYRQSSYYF